MKKPDLIAAIATRTGSTRAAAEAALSALREIAEEEIAAGRRFELPGVIGLSVRTRAARTGRNPATGAPIQIAECQIVKPRVPSTLAALAR